MNSQHRPQNPLQHARPRYGTACRRNLYTSPRTDEPAIPRWVGDELLRILHEMEPLPYDQQLAYFLFSLSDAVLAFMNSFDPLWLDLTIIDKFRQHAEKIKGRLRVDSGECSKRFRFLLAIEELRRKNVATIRSYPKDLFQLLPVDVL